MRNRFLSAVLLGGIFAFSPSATRSAHAAKPQTAVPTSYAASCVFDISMLPTVEGKISRLLPGTHGDVVGVIFADGNEVVMPPGLAAQDHNLRIGAPLAVRGLVAPSLHLVRAFALAGQPVVCAAPMPEMVTASPPTSAQGVVERLLHDGDGAVAGALLTDGTVLRTPAAGARSADLVPGKTVYADGKGYQTAYGKLVLVDILGPSRAQAVHISDEPPVPRGAAPGSPAYDELPGAVSTGDE